MRYDKDIPHPVVEVSCCGSFLQTLALIGSLSGASRHLFISAQE